MLNTKYQFALLVLLTTLTISSAVAQSDYIGPGNKQYQLLDRLDIKLRNDSVLSFTSAKPYNRKRITAQIAHIASLDKGNQLPISLSAVDRYNLQRLLMNNSEWNPVASDTFKSAKSIFGIFYKTPSTMYAVDKEDFVLRVDPLLNLQYGHSNDGTGNIYTNSRGLRLRGNIAGKVGFYTSLLETQERDPGYVRDFTEKFNAVPGQGFFKGKGTKTFDFLEAKGGIAFDGGKHFDIMFAYDKLFIGNGFRSLFLSDFSNNYLFLKINTRVWKLSYQNIFAEQIAPFNTGSDTLRPKKYMAAHHLSFQAAKWLNIGLFESVSFGRKTGSGFELSYLNPLIFYRAAEHQLGSPDKVSLGIDLKANVTSSVQFYSQLLINEFVLDEVLRYNRGYWRNKHALQLGGKYIDALGIRNLDLQAELNVVRPYVYTHFDSSGSFSHYNQPLAHPLGANFREFVALAKYQPTPKLYLVGKLITYTQGLDSAGFNFGSNIFLDYRTRVRGENLFIGSGVPVKSLLLGFNAAYEIFENMFFDLNATYRTYNIQGQPKSSAFYYSLGFRVNLQRREFDF